MKNRIIIRLKYNKPMTEDDPFFLSEEENELAFNILDRTPQIGREEAIRRVIGNERSRRRIEAKATAKRRASAGSRTTKPYRARFQDSTDESVRAAKEGLEGTDVSEGEVEAGREYHDFIQRVREETDSFDIAKYLQIHPEQTEEARRLGLIE